MAGVIAQHAPSWPRMIAVLLALGGSFWGVFLLLVFGPFALVPLPFGVGYLVTAGYIARAVSVLSLTARRVLWVASLAVQGAWLMSVGFPDLPRTGPDLFFCWWSFATAASAVALVTERGSADAEPLVCGQSEKK